MLEVKIIIPSSSPWAAPIVLVDKPDGSIRFYIDYRKLNHITKIDAYPMPHLDDLIETVRKGQYVSSLDLTKGFWQMPLDPKDQEKMLSVAPLAFLNSGS